MRREPPLTTAWYYPDPAPTLRRAVWRGARLAMLPLAFLLAGALIVPTVIIERLTGTDRFRRPRTRNAR